MKSILIGVVVISLTLLLSYSTGKIANKWSTDESTSDYLSTGCMIWGIIGFILTIAYMIGEIVLYLVK